MNKRFVYLNIILGLILILFASFSLSCKKSVRKQTKNNELHRSQKNQKKSAGFDYKRYFDLPDDLYIPEQGLELHEYDVISKRGKLTNSERFDVFLENVKNKKKDLIRIINFYPPVIHLLVFNGKDILYFQDSTRFIYGSPKIIKLKGEKISTKKFAPPPDSGSTIIKIVYYVVGKAKVRQPIVSTFSYQKKIKNSIVLESVKTNYSKQIDLNGDLKVDKVSLNEVLADQTTQTGSIRVNDALLPIFSTGEVVIVDIDTNDKFKEIAFWNGDEEDADTDFYYFDGNKIISMGSMAGSIDSIGIDGSGIVKTYCRSDFLQTWAYADRYKLSKEHLLENIPQELYDMYGELTLAADLPIQKSRTNPEIITVLKKGEKIKLLKTDNRVWCLVQNKNGVNGWFAISNNIIAGTQKRPEEIFSDLSLAD